ncbi:MAG: hypothetical protein ACK58L_00600 [Planctomycetota bacterium]
MNNDSPFRRSRVTLTAGIVICSMLAVCSVISTARGRQPRTLSLSHGRPATIAEANRQLSKSYDEFYPGRTDSSRSIRTASQPEVQVLTHSSTVSDDTSRRPEIIQSRHTLDSVHSDDVTISNPAQSRNQMTTATVVEATGNSSDRGAQPTPLAHITVPVTVNVDNGEILTELMRLQEEVILTRGHLSDDSSPSEPSSDSPASESLAAVEVPSDTAPSAIAVQGPSPAVDSELQSANRLPEPLESFTSPEPSGDDPRSTKADTPQQITAESDASSEMPSETAKTNAVPPINTQTAEEPGLTVPDFTDFSEPHSGLPVDPLEQHLPSFDPPPQANSSPATSLNSYTEWVHSFEVEEAGPDETQRVTQIVYEDELPSFPEMEMPEEAAKPAAAEIVTPLLTIPAEPLSDPGKTEIANEQPSTPVPPVPVRSAESMDGFHEPSTIPVFPVTETKSNSVGQTSVPAQQVSWAAQTPSVMPLKSSSAASSAPAPSIRKPVSRVTTSRSGSAMRSAGEPYSSASEGVSRSGPPIASRLKGVKSPSAPRAPESPGLLARMKSRVSSAVNRVSKPDFDTPIWVDRLADWKDERTGKGSPAEPQTARSMNAVASQPRGNHGMHARPGSADHRSSPASRSSSVRQPVTKIPGRAANSEIAGSKSQPRANVTTVPRAGQQASQVSRTALAAVPKSIHPPAAAIRPQQPSAASMTSPTSKQSVSAASYHKEVSSPSQKSVSQSGYSEGTVPPARLPEMNQLQPHAAQTAMHGSSKLQQGREIYPRDSQSLEHTSVASTYHGPVEHQTHVSFPMMQTQFSDAQTEYVGTLDAFSYRMTMVIRPPSLSVPGSDSVSRWFSNARSAASSTAAPAVHRVSSTIRYSTQPKTVR